MGLYTGLILPEWKRYGILKPIKYKTNDVKDTGIHG